MTLNGDIGLLTNIMIHHTFLKASMSIAHVGVMLLEEKEEERSSQAFILEQ